MREQATEFTLQPARSEDRERLADLRAEVLRDDLTRLGRFDEERVRERFRRAFEPRWTWIITGPGSALIGCIALRAEAGGRLLEHFYIDPAYQNRGIGSRVLGAVLEKDEAKDAVVRLNVLQGSPARRLYERFGFRAYSEDAVDVFMSRPPEV